MIDQLTGLPVNQEDILIVTRHTGLIEWLHLRGIHGTVKSHVQEEDVADKVIIGTLPMLLASLAKCCIVVDMPYLPESERGKDLLPSHMDKYGARLTLYIVRRLL